MKTIRN